MLLHKSKKNFLKNTDLNVNTGTTSIKKQVVINFGSIYRHKFKWVRIYRNYKNKITKKKIGRII